LGGQSVPASEQPVCHVTDGQDASRAVTEVHVRQFSFSTKLYALMALLLAALLVVG
jgi:hypothetical protein